MPRIRNLVDYSGQGESRRPYETLIDIPQRDSVNTITIHIEPNHFIQLKRDDTDPSGWQAVTNLTIVISSDKVDEGDQGSDAKTSHHRSDKFQGVIKDKLAKAQGTTGK